MLSHELRNPLSPILNALGILKQVRTHDPLIQQAGGIIERQVGQMVRMVDDLLDISRITKGKLRLTKERVDLRTVMNRAADSARPLLSARHHEFSLLLPTETLWVEGDPEPAGADRRQPAQQRGQVHRPRRAGADERRPRGGRRGGAGDGQRRRHPAGHAPPHLRPVHPGGHVAQPVARRAGHRPGPGPHPGGDARRAGDGGQRRVGQGERVRRQDAGAGGRGRAGARRPPWSRASDPGNRCESWWWKTTSTPGTA